MQLYTYICGSKINNNDKRTQFFRKIYFSHFIRNGCKRVTKGLCVRCEFETEQTETYWPQVPLPLSALLSRSAGLLNRGSWGPIDLCWVLVLSTASYLQLTDFKLTKLPVAPGYIIVCLNLLPVSVIFAPNSTRPQSRLSPVITVFHKTWCDVQQLWKAVIPGDTVTRLSIPIWGRGKSPEEGPRWNLAET